MKKLSRLSLITAMTLSIFMPQISWSAMDVDSEQLEVGQVTPSPDPHHVPESKPTPFSFSSSFDAVAKAKIKKGFHKGEELRFAVAEIEGALVFYYDPVYTEGANVALTYEVTRIQWDENLYIDQSLFHTVSLSFGFFTKRIDNWLWRAQIAANADSPGKNFTGEYINYDALVWGRYEFNKCIGVHAGFLLQTGMRMDKGWPIFGFDWQINPKWKLNLVYPVNISLDYDYSKNWTLGLAARLFNSRHRVKRDECNGRSLVRYENTGAEFYVKYEAHNVEYNVHAGTTLGGRYRIASPSNNHPRTVKLCGAPYVGAEANVKF
jgi:hypothetical protein